MKLDAQRAIYSKLESRRRDYHVVAMSDGPQAQDVLERMFRALATDGVANEIRANRELGVFTFAGSPDLPQDTPKPTFVATRDQPTGFRDGASRLFSATDGLLLPLDELPAGSLTAIADALLALRWADYLDSKTLPPVSATLPEQPELLRRLVDDFRDDAVFTTAAAIASLLLAYPEVVLVNTDTPALLPWPGEPRARVQWFDRALALLPAGCLASFSATTWTEQMAEHPIRLAFGTHAAASTGRRNVVGWHELREPPLTVGLAQEYFEALSDVRTHHGTAAPLLDLLASQRTPLRPDRDHESIRLSFLPIYQPLLDRDALDAGEAKLPAVLRILGGDNQWDDHDRQRAFKLGLAQLTTSEQAEALAGFWRTTCLDDTIREVRNRLRQHATTGIAPILDLAGHQQVRALGAVLDEALKILVANATTAYALLLPYPSVLADDRSTALRERVLSESFAPGFFAWLVEMTNDPRRGQTARAWLEQLDALPMRAQTQRWRTVALVAAGVARGEVRGDDLLAIVQEDEEAARRIQLVAGNAVMIDPARLEHLLPAATIVHLRRPPRAATVEDIRFGVPATASDRFRVRLDLYRLALGVETRQWFDSSFFRFALDDASKASLYAQLVQREAHNLGYDSQTVTRKMLRVCMAITSDIVAIPAQNLRARAENLTVILNALRSTVTDRVDQELLESMDRHLTRTYPARTRPYRPTTMQDLDRLLGTSASTGDLAFAVANILYANPEKTSGIVELLARSERMKYSLMWDDFVSDVVAVWRDWGTDAAWVTRQERLLAREGLENRYFLTDSDRYPQHVLNDRVRPAMNALRAYLPVALAGVERSDERELLQDLDRLLNPRPKRGISKLRR